MCTLFPRRIPHKYKGCLVLVTGCRGVGKKRRDRERERDSYPALFSIDKNLDDGKCGCIVSSRVRIVYTIV